VCDNLNTDGEGCPDMYIKLNSICVGMGFVIWNSLFGAG